LANIIILIIFIFLLYKKGWSVKDLSVRYGILPERVKAIVWLETKFYFEILPNVSMETVKRAMDIENSYS
jgi:hypothetical protein